MIFVGFSSPSLVKRSFFLSSKASMVNSPLASPDLRALREWCGRQQCWGTGAGTVDLARGPGGVLGG